MTPYAEMTKDEMKRALDELLVEYDRFQNLGLNLDMSRGKPCKEQLDLSMGMMDALYSGADMTADLPG